MKESEFQKTLKVKLKSKFPDCIILKNDPNCIQGFPDLIVLFGKLWAALEVKKSSKAAHRPNQDYYINKVKDGGGFASFIFPENEEKILTELEKYFFKNSRKNHTL